MNIVDELLRSVAGTNTPVCVSTESGSDYDLATVMRVADDLVLLACVTPRGEFSGYKAISPESIVEVWTGGKYYDAVASLMESFQPPKFPIESCNSFNQLLDALVQEGCSVMLYRGDTDAPRGIIKAYDDTWIQAEMFTYVLGYAGTYYIRRSEIESYQFMGPRDCLVDSLNGGPA